MQCPRCQHENPTGQKFCGECGARLEALCPACKAANPPSQKFCGECGERLPQAARPVEPSLPAPQSYTPPHLAERILASRGALEGERKQVTVLFADLKGSLELLADRDPEEARRLLDPVLERMMEAVHRYEGTVNSVMGDGIMALFGAPLGHEDHAVRACYAALRMQQSSRRLAGEMMRAGRSSFQIRVGLNSGEVVVRSIGSDLHMDYSAIGQTTHLAARMEQLASPGSIRLTADTLGLAEGYLQVKPLGSVPVKGLAEPVECYELVGAAPVSTRLHASAARGLTRFVGRETELEAIYRALERAAGGHGQVVALVGEPGVGKSRLVWELTHSQQTEGWTILQAGSVSYGKATPYLPVIDLLKTCFRIEGRDDTRTIREKVTRRLRSLDRPLEPMLPAFLSLLEVPVEDSSWEALDPAQRRRRILEAGRRLLLRESRESSSGGLLLVFEDLHWIDAETQALLDSLVESLPTARLVLLASYRPEYEHRWGSRTYYTQLRIDPLPPDGADELLSTLLGEGALLQPLKERLIERTEGNPFFLEETVRTLVEAGALVGERGSYSLARPVDSIRTPATVQAVLAARIDRLEPEVKRLLQSAAVIGKDVPFAILRAVADTNAGGRGLEAGSVDDADDALRRDLTELQAAEFLYEASLFPELEYTFKHALTHEVAYGSLLQERRRATHARVVEAVERLYAERQAEEVERLAYHAIRGEAWDKALAYSRQAGLKAMQHSALPQAVAHLEQALAALGHLPETRDTLEQAIDIRIELRSSLYPLGRHGGIIERLREAEAIAEALDDQSRLARVGAYLASCFNTMGSPALAVEPAQRALAIGEAEGDLGARVLGNHFLGLAYHSLGAFGRAAELLRRNVEVLQGDLVSERFGMHGVMFVFSRSPLIWSLAELGEFPEAIALNQESFQIAETVDHAPTRGGACMGVSLLHVRKGDLDSAIAVGEHCVELCQTRGLAAVFPMVAAQLGYAHVLAGRVTQGLSLLTRAVEQGESVGFLPNHSLWVGWLGEGYLLAGRTADALDHAERALKLSRERNERGSQAWALRLRAEIESSQGPRHVEQAEDYYRQALALAEELRMRPLQAHCHLGLGTLHRKIGRREEACAALSQAVEMLRAMEMILWLPQAEAELTKMG